MKSLTTKYLFIALIFIGYSRCSSVTNENAISSAKLIVHELTTSVPLDSSMTKYWYSFSQFQDKNLITFQNRIRSDPEMIFLYDYETDSMQELSFEKYGPHGVSTPNGHYYHNDDSVFLIDAHRYKVTLADRHGFVKRRFKIIEGKYGLDTSLPWVKRNSPKLYGDTLYIPANPDARIFRDQAEITYCMIALNVADGGYEYKIRSPEIFLTKNMDYSFSDYSMHIEYPFVYMVFAHLDILYRYNLQDNSVVQLPINGELFQVNSEEMNGFGDVDSRFYQTYGQTAYCNLIIDPKENLALLFGRAGFERKVMENHRQFAATPFHNYLQIYDLKEERLFKEVDLKSKYEVSRSFLTEEGLFIGHNDDNEDYNHFDLFEIEIQ